MPQEGQGPTKPAWRRYARAVSPDITGPYRGKLRPGDRREDVRVWRQVYAFEIPGIIALVAALMLYDVGGDPSSSARLIVAANTLGLLLSVSRVIVSSYNRSTFSIVALRLGFLIFYFGPATNYLMSRDVADVVAPLAYAGPSAYLRAVVYVVVMYHVALLTVVVLSVVVREGPVRTSAGGVVGRKAVPYVVAFSIIPVTTFVLMSGGLERAVEYVVASRVSGAPWRGSAVRELRPIIYFLHGLLATAGILLILLIARLNLPRRYTLLLSFLAFLGIAVPVLERGTRSLMFPGILALLYAMLTRPNALGRQVRGRRWQLLLGVAALGVVILAVSNYVRNTRTRALDQRDFDLGTEELMADHGMNFVNEAALAVQITDTLGLRLDNPMILVVLSTPLPRVLFPWKPDSTTAPVYTYQKLGVITEKTGNTAMPGVVGQCYMNWGVMGIFYGGLILGVAVYVGRRLLVPSTLAVNGVVPRELAGLAVLAYVVISMRMIGRIGVMETILAYPVGYALGKLGAWGSRGWRRGTRGAERVGTL